MARKKIVSGHLKNAISKDEHISVKFVNCIMRDGKKSVAEKVFKDAMELVEEKLGESSLKVFEKAIGNIRPSVEVKSRRVGGSTYQVPTEIKSSRQTALAFRWLLRFSRSRSEKGLSNKLAAELLDAYNERGGAVKKKEDTHKMAEANKAFAHFRW
ncbi:RpsG [Desulforapulum autotrophicum HRM2]|uniref:Small ribosomal subunit protein uS7 n=1 Tax=Desulforapulum autotrophicum (strain ATCC 43914 / DSM 3382 / VKM B-1955 / HRM2) TaxID=177437 RepID=RS7_DESAH|nr:30S ribosomal protein S7 [Desulforapulum autotrophicum]C0Q9X6.1 RecName: Full=Small ribosomal subunit protein uS7; AltName: Full=30S ribosomal protein S7 [Desulforapulum autotrophicum HRM2]ACN16694.1 RpsG [Desulforapulum autotrophicum HRM2]